MKRQVIVNGQTADLELALSGHSVCFRFDGGPSGELSVIEVEPGVYSVLWDGRSFQARVGEGVIEVDSERFAVDVRDLRDWPASDTGATAHGRQEVSAPMPGRVIRVLVEEGQLVDAGQGIVVVEAMKMQNEMQAARSGRVASVCVNPGTAVGAGDVLAVIE
jgi:biotin carboxyl carrier protein